MKLDEIRELAKALRESVSPGTDEAITQIVWPTASKSEEVIITTRLGAAHTIEVLCEAVEIYERRRGFCEELEQHPVHGETFKAANIKATEIILAEAERRVALKKER